MSLFVITKSKYANEEGGAYLIFGIHELIGMLEQKYVVSSYLAHMVNLLTLTQVSYVALTEIFA